MVVKIVVITFAVWMFWSFVFWLCTKGKESLFSLGRQYLSGSGNYVMAYVLIAINTYYIYGVSLPVGRFWLYLLAYSCQLPIFLCSTSKSKMKDHLIEILLSVVMTICLFVFFIV